MSNILPIETVSEIRIALERGDGIRAIARKFGISTNTVQRYKKEGTICACGKPLHSGLCSEKHARTAGLVSYKRRMQGVDDGYRKPERRSRTAETRDKILFVFGFLPGWEDRARCQQPSDQEYYGILGEVERVTRKISPEYRDDVRSEMSLACFEGRLLREEIPAFVGKFVMFEMMRYLGHRISRFSSLFDPLRGKPKGGGGRNGQETTLFDMLVNNITSDDDYWSWGARQSGPARQRLLRSEVSAANSGLYGLHDHV